MKPRVKAPNSEIYHETAEIVKQYNLHTICQEASCPNIGECWSKRHASFIILGDICTRACSFCNVKTGRPYVDDPDEPRRVAEAVYKMGLKHVVVTSVTRDDLPDGGATHFANTIKSIREISPGTTVEVLTPDFLDKEGALEIVINAAPDVYNHNLETVPRLYATVRRGARYYNSLNLLHRAKLLGKKDIFTKSGIMVGLGETEDEVYQVMDDLLQAEVDFITIGQYLQPTPKHHPVIDYISDEKFEYYKTVAEAKGFLMVSASALTRSSYHADSDFEELKKKRA